jgi:lipid II:glycine glycyltransferase (peptidoglycan interpeptide bridge formation enzyme)
VASLASASFLQCPSWGQVKSEWRAESVGWRDAGGTVVGAGLVLYRKIPRLDRYLAYLPEGPIIDWTDPDLGRWLTPMVAHLRSRGAFAVKIGPRVETRRWEAAGIKAAIAAKTPTLREVARTG